MKTLKISLIVLLSLCVFGCDSNAPVTEQNSAVEGDDEAKHHLASCLTANNWSMYSSNTCSACRSQKEVFGSAFEKIKEIECNPHAEPNQVDQCIQRKIRKTPTWIQEVDGNELNRIEGYWLLSDLAEQTNCL